MEPLKFDININENIKGFSVRQTVRNGQLVEMTVTLRSDDALALNNLLASKLAPVLAWKNHSLYQWAQRKTGKV